MVSVLKDTYFGLARDAGVLEGKGVPGPFSEWYPDLEMTFLLAALRRDTYTDDPGPRLRRHTLVRTRMGWGKSSGAKGFIDKAIGAIAVDRHLPRENIPAYFPISGSGTSFERLRGGVSDGKFMDPVFKNVPFLYLSEMMSFLQKGDEVVEPLLQILEEGHVTIFQMQLGKLDLEDDEIERLAERGIIWNKEIRCISYDSNATVIAATRDIDEQKRKELEQSGFFDRFFISEWMGTEDVNTRNVWMQRRRGPSEIFEDLRLFNAKAWKAMPSEVCRPPDSMFSVLLESMDQGFSAIEEEMGLAVIDVRSFRDHGVIEQALTAAAFERSVRQWNGHDPFKIEYKPGDALVAGHFVSRHVEAKRMEKRQEVMGKRDEDRNLGKDMMMIQRLRAVFGLNPFTVKEALATSKIEMRKSAFYTFISRCVERGRLQEVKRGTYSIVPSP